MAFNNQETGTGDLERRGQIFGKPMEYKEGALVAIKRTEFRVGLKVHRIYLRPDEVCQKETNENVVKVGKHGGLIRTHICRIHKPMAK